MSKNKERYQKQPLSKQLLSDAADKPQAGDAETPKLLVFANPKDSQPRGWLGYLKKHWWISAITVFFSISALAGGLKYLEDEAKREIAANWGKPVHKQKRGLLSSVNPFLRNPSPMTTPQIAKEYIYAGSRMLAVEDANASAAPPADLAVWRPSSGYWYVMGAGGTFQAMQQWGLTGDAAVPGDYDGDGKADFSVFRPSNNRWYVMRSSDNSYFEVPFGASGDKPVPADFDGDGKTDIAVFRPSDTTWYINKSSDPNSHIIQQFGIASDKLAPADYDGDGKADICVWRGSDYAFYSLKSSNWQFQAVTLGLTTSDTPVSADYDGDGKADFALRSKSSWLIKYSSNNQNETITPSWELTPDKPVQNDYDGDGKVDIAVWRDTNGDWYIRNSSTGQLRQEHWGMTGDIPVPAFWKR